MFRCSITVAGDKGYDTQDFVAGLRTTHVTPHLAQYTTGRQSAIDARTTRHTGYAISQHKRKLVERAACNIVRLHRLMAATA